ncbi:hypothetical protein HYU90_01310 [Candidatus Collierbacteria bacterium]|nr:hypothetical protein [Candidatus Collierbacteria bacterium]
MMKETLRINSLDLGKLGSRVEKWVETINIPYLYLPDFLRKDMPNVVRTYIQPIMQDMSRAGKLPLLMTEQIRSEKERLSPDKVSVGDYLSENLRMYEEKVNLHFDIQQLILAWRSGAITDIDLVRQGIGLLDVASGVEPWHFAIGGLAKKYIEKYMSLMPQDLPEDDFDLVMVTGIPCAYVTFEMDLREYLISGETEKQTLRPGLMKRYFNDDPLYFDMVVDRMSRALGGYVNDKIQRKEIRREIDDVRDAFRSRWVRKVNLLVERKVRFAEELDRLMVMDSCFDKYLEYKALFLHDLFLKMAILDLARKRKVFDLSPINLEERMKETLFLTDEEFKTIVAKYLG